jgi:hypothetical protein
MRLKIEYCGKIKMELSNNRENGGTGWKRKKHMHLRRRILKRIK